MKIGENGTEQNAADEAKPVVRTSRRLSILGMLGIVSAFTLAFAAARFAGAIGGSFGAFVVMVSIGLAFSLPRLTAGGIFAAVFLVVTVLCAWRFYGTLDVTDRWYAIEVTEDLELVISWLEEYREQNGEYPARLNQLKPVGAQQTYRIQSPNEAALMMHYERKEGRHELVHLGEDRVWGGRLKDADASLLTLSTVCNQSLHFDEFLRNQHSVVGLTWATMFSWVFAVGIAMGKRTKINKAGVIVFIFELIVVAVFGVLMVGFYIVGSQSGH